MRRPILVIITMMMMTILVLPVDNNMPLAVDPIQSDTLDDGVSEPLFSLSSNLGSSAVIGNYCIVELPGASIVEKGTQLQVLLNSSGIVTSLVTVSQVLLEPSILGDSQVIILDGSLGSGNGSIASDAFLSILYDLDKPLVTIGRASWVLHRLMGATTPLETAHVTQQLLTESEYASAVFMSSPNVLIEGAPLTTEDVTVPINTVQYEKTRLVNLTRASSPVEMASIQYVSWPLDTILYGPEDPSLLTIDGQGLLVNILSYITSLRETETSQVLAAAQADVGEPLAGGFSYLHEPILESVYLAVHTMKGLLDAGEWTSWRSNHTPLISNLLTDLYVDLGTEAGFYDSVSGASISERTTAYGLYITSTIGLGGQFDEGLLSSYLANRQEPAGGFSDSITTTYYVTEALWASGRLPSIDTTQLQWWLEECEIVGGSDFTLWGAIAYSPDNTSASNLYAAQYVLSMSFLGESHSDPLKLSEWIIDETYNPDGSYSNTKDIQSEIVTGTASAVTCLEELGTLPSSNMTQTLAWLSNNQLDSGGFGLDASVVDIVGKMRETARVSIALETLSETSGSLASGVISFINYCETSLGFERMEPIPSLLWGASLAKGSRLMHSSGYVDYEHSRDYLSGFNSFSMYSNLTALSSPEYALDQYRVKGVWSYLSGVSMGWDIGYSLDIIQTSDALSYLSLSQHAFGHYKPSTSFGTPGMQYSVAAIEALYLLDRLDVIPYRASLESAILSEYSSGQWDSVSWTLEPYVGSQSAIDYLCTRVALRLGILNSAMASEIAANIQSRVQYSDLWALSRDTATLALLDSSLLVVDLDSIDSVSVLNALGPSPFVNGWYNTTILWQPVFTADVLEMLSILGLRTQVYETEGSSVVASVPVSPLTGGTMDIQVSITSPLSIHTVYVNAFGEWTRFDDVTNSDTLTVIVPSDENVLGPTVVYVMVWDNGSSRGFDITIPTIRGTLDGSMVIDTPSVLVGDRINGTVSWNLSPSGDAGLTQVIVRLGDPPTYQQWTYESSSPYNLSVTTDAFVPGEYNLTVTLTRPYCDPLILKDSVIMDAPVLTYLVSPSIPDGNVGEMLQIPWSLHYSSNSSYIESQVVVLEVRDLAQQLVHTDSELSTSGLSLFSWTPDALGNYTYTIIFARNGTMEGTQLSDSTLIYEDTQFQWFNTGVHDQTTIVTLSALLSTESGAPLSGNSVTVTVTAPSSTRIIDTVLVTNTTGHITIQFTLSENGFYNLSAQYSGSGLLISSSSLDTVISWSDSSLPVGGMDAEGVIGVGWDIWARLTDSSGNPLPSQLVTLRIVYLPSTIMFQQTLLTNSTGHVSAEWTSSTPGDFSLEAEYLGSTSRGAASNSSTSTLRVPVALSIDSLPDYTVGIITSTTLYVEDHTGSPISGITLTLTVWNPLGQIVYQTSGTSAVGQLVIQWTPTSRGTNNLTVSCLRQSWYESNSTTIQEGIVEQPSVMAEVIGVPTAPSSGSVTLTVTDYYGLGIEGVVVRTLVLLNSNTILDTFNTTEVDGTVTLELLLTEPGDLSIAVSCEAQGWLLETQNSTETDVLGTTTLTLDASSIPVSQGTTLGIIATLWDWNSIPMVGSQISISVEFPNGTVISLATLHTGVGGACTFGHVFDTVGDFILRATYSGVDLNASSTLSKLQRVYCTPSLWLNHGPTVLLGQASDFWLAITDGLGHPVAGRILTLTVIMNSVVVFESQSLSGTVPTLVQWSPTERGLVSINLAHTPDTYYLSNYSGSSMSVLEVVSSELALSVSTIDLFDSVTLTYTLTAGGISSGVDIVFEVLGIDLIPVWSAQVVTDGSGIAQVVYLADDVYGILSVEAGPDEDQFLVGGGTQEDLTVMTECVVTADFLPAPAQIGQEANITIWAEDELGGAIDGFEVRVSLYYQGQPVDLGGFWGYVDIIITNGIASTPFTPQSAGLYDLDIILSTDRLSIHAFTDSSSHAVHSPTSLSVVNIDSDIELGQTMSVTAILLDYSGAPMIGRVVTFQLDGPGATVIGPIDLATNTTGHVEWQAQLNIEGLWTLDVSFAGIGVYLPDAISDYVDVRYGTVLTVERIGNDNIIAGQNPLSVIVLLEDSGGTPLEGRPVKYEAYHDDLGLLSTGIITQSGSLPEALNISLSVMGNYTVVFSFVGTDHYHPSTSAVRVWVIGTTAPIITGPSELDRSDTTPIMISILDEQEIALDPSLVSLVLVLAGDSGQVSIMGRVNYTTASIQINITGLQVGHYVLNITIPTCQERIGSTLEYSFNVKTQIGIVVTMEELPGLVGYGHEVTAIVIDSINDAVTSSEVWVSIYDPEGREVYGNFLSTRTLVQVPDGQFTIAWTPSRTGNYTLVMEFESDELRNGSILTVIILTRYHTELILISPESASHLEQVTITVSLIGGTGKLSGTLVTLTVSLGNETVKVIELETDLRGSAQTDLEYLPAGDIRLTVSYGGSDTYVPCTKTSQVLVSPVVDLYLLRDTAIVGTNTSVILQVEVLGVVPDWIGTLGIGLRDPYGTHLEEWVVPVTWNGTVEFYLLVHSEGEYSLNLNITGLPAISNYSTSIAVLIVPPAFDLTLNAETASIFGGGLGISLLALVLRRRLAGLVGTLPADWEG